jgi:hypothetical protein
MHSLVRRIGAFALTGAVLVTVPVLASRMDYKVRSAGKDVRDAEVCLFPADALDDFPALFLRSGDVRCYDATKVIHVPKGFWSVFAEAPGFVSTQPVVTEVSAMEDRPEDEQFHISEIEVLPAASISIRDLKMNPAEGERAVVYIHNESFPSARATIRPSRPGASTISVPANVTLVPMIVKGATIVWAGPARNLRQGETWVIKRDIRQTVASFITVPRALLPMTRAAVPSVELMAKDGRHFKPELPLRASPLFADSLLLFRDIPAGLATITLQGADWVSDEISLTVPNGPATTGSSRGLRAVRRSQLRAAWSIARRLFEAAPPSCDPHTSSPVATSLTLEACSERDCKVLETVDVPASADRGDHVFSNLIPGRYQLDLARGQLNARSLVFDVAPASSTTVAVDLDAKEISGRLTRAGMPVHGIVRFRTGSAVSDPLSGEYRAYVTDAPGYDRIRIGLCGSDQTYIHVPPAEVRVDMRYDIDLPSNTLHVRVTNAQTNAPVAGARVIVTTMGGKDAAVELDHRDLDDTSSDGQTTATDVSSDTDVTVCAYRKTFARRCTEKRRFPASGESDVELALQPQSEAAGKIVTPRPIERGMLFLVRDRVVLTSAAVAADGSFSLSRIPAAMDRLYFTARSYPLYILQVPPGDASLTFELAEEPRKTFTVTCPTCRSDARSLFDVIIGGEPLPLDVFASHQNAHDGQIALGKGESTVVADMPVRGSLAVVRGWSRPEVPPQFANVVDQFALPELLRTFASVPVTTDPVALP